MNEEEDLKHRLRASPSMRREWIEMVCRISESVRPGSLPPCGGSGLKFCRDPYNTDNCVVSLHAEGVD